jgi:hypothetical protein
MVMPPINREQELRRLTDAAMQEQSLRRSRIFLDAAIESHIIDAGVGLTIRRLQNYIDQLREFERSDSHG